MQELILVVSRGPMNSGTTTSSHSTSVKFSGVTFSYTLNRKIGLSQGISYAQIDAIPASVGGGASAQASEFNETKRFRTYHITEEKACSFKPQRFLAFLILTLVN